MNSYRALIKIDLRLALRQRSVIFFNYLFPLVFFFVFATAMHAERGSGMTRVISMVVVIGVLGGGLFGAGMRAVQEREANILRRYKVTPISPAPLLVASTVTGWVLFMPYVVVMFCLAHYMYGMPWPEQFASLLLFISMAIVAFRSIGLILAAVANSMQESQILIQLIYLPMLFLSGATFPATMFPWWLKEITQFLPATHLVTGIQGMLLSNQSLREGPNATAAFAMVLTTFVGLFIAYKLFRWEKEEKIKASSKLWLLAIMLPFVVLGAINVRTHQNLTQQRIQARQLARGDTFLIRGARIFVGDGRVIEQGAVLVRGGKIAAVYEGMGPDPKSVKAEVEEAAGKTILPGLIDVHVHLGAPGGFVDWKSYAAEQGMERELAAYLYSGVTAVRSTGDVLDGSLKLRARVNSGELLGAEFFACGPLFTAKGGHGTEYFKGLPDQARQMMEQQFVRIPTSPAEARQQVDDLKKAGVDGLKAVLEAGAAPHLFNRLDPALLSAIAEEARAQNLPLAVHTGDANDVADALKAGVASIEHGSMRDAIRPELFDQMARQGTFYDPTLSAGEAIHEVAAGKADLLKRPLVQQAAPADLIKGTEAALASKETEEMRRAIGQLPADLALATQNLRQALGHKVALVTGSDAGNILIVHGPTVQHELALWVKAGIPAAIALQAATLNAARLLRADQRMGSIQPGRDADLLIVDGNPLEDISATERVSLVVFKGERLNRAELFDQH